MWKLVWFVMVKRHVQWYLSYRVTEKLSSFQIAVGNPKHRQLGLFSCRAYLLRHRSGKFDDFICLLAVGGPAGDEGTSGIEPRSTDPQSSPLPLHHHNGQIWNLLSKSQQIKNEMRIQTCRKNLRLHNTFRTDLGRSIINAIVTKFVCLTGITGPNLSTR